MSTITRHAVTASTTDLAPTLSADYPAGLFVPTGPPVWGDGTTTPAGWGTSVPQLAISSATDARGLPVLHLSAPAAVPVGFSGMYRVFLPGTALPAGLYRVAAWVATAGSSAVSARARLSANGASTQHVAGPSAVPLGPEFVEVWSVQRLQGTPVDQFVHIEQQRTATGAVTGVLVAGVSVTPVAYTDTLDLHPTAASITLDESWSPYARATLTCPAPAPDVVARLDPRRPTRIKLTTRRAVGDAALARDLPDLLPPGMRASHLSAAFAGPPPRTAAYLSQLVGAPYQTPARVDLATERTYDLMLRARSVDHVAGTLTLECTSDEMALQDLARWDVDFRPELRPPTTTSLVALVRWALDLLGWDLAAGARDVTIDPTSVVWNLGEQLWDFLDAHIRAANRRLWCDEQRRWHLTEPMTGTTGAPVMVERPTAAVDTLSRGDGYADTTVVVYEWTDDQGQQQRAYGYADWSTGQPVTLVQRWNAPGDVTRASEAADGLRRRAATRGRQVDVEAVADPTVTPGRPLVVTGTTTAVQQAMVSAVTWDYPADVMTIRSRDAAT